MKIIGKTDNGFVVTMERVELEKLSDLYYGKGDFKVGTEIQIDKMYEQVKMIGCHKDEMDIIKRSLLKIVDNLTLVEPFIVPESEEAPHA